MSAPACAVDSFVAAPTALLSSYRAGDTLFSSPSTQLHARGSLRVVRESVNEGVADAAYKALHDAARETGPLPLIGAVPFEASAPSRLWIPAQAVHAAGQARHAGAASTFAASERNPVVEAQPSPARFRENVADAIASIRGGGLDKVVLSRSLRIQANVDVPQLVSRLLERMRDRNGYTFAIDLASAGGAPACLVGASPELLLSKRGAVVVSNPLAGSIARAINPDEDCARARQLLSSAKDLHEHALVVSAVEAALAPHCLRLSVPREPVLASTPTMWHLSTRVQGRLRDPEASSLRLALDLHPTPAVCGHPTASARALIRDVEGYPRDLFTGLVGWCDVNGDGEWAVTIRCALIDDTSATVYAGAGIVDASNPQLELEETTAKLRTMLSAMGLAHALELPEACGDTP